VLADGAASIRDRAAFDARVAEAGRHLFGEAMQRLKLAEDILARVAELRPRLEPPIMGWARANLDDLRQQLDALIAPGFLRRTPASALEQVPRYLQAMLRRVDRLLQDPGRDQARMLELQPFVDALAQARARGEEQHPGWVALRWDLEELRVSLFAQELGTRGPVSTKRVARQLEELRRAK
jgi:ATP-dependent helicase HrpA